MVLSFIDEMKLEEQRDIFNIFHDGSIVSISDQNNLLTLKIEIQYLAELISEEFDHFFVDLISCDILKFINWGNEKTILDIQIISKLEPEILNCDKEVTDMLRILCALSIGPGGELWIKTKEIKIFDQKKNEITIDELRRICKKYWDRFGKN